MPSEWTVDGKVPPRYFNDWFTSESGAGENATARLTKWLQNALKEGNLFDSNTLGKEEADAEDVNEVYPCGKCKKPVWERFTPDLVTHISEGGGMVFAQGI